MKDNADERSGDGKNSEQGGVKPGEVAPIDEPLGSELDGTCKETEQQPDLKGVTHESQP